MDTRSTLWPRIKRASIKNSGVLVRAVVDDNDNDNDMQIDTYYGQIEKIWEHDYVGLKVALFRCRSVTNGKRAVSKDKYYFFSVDLRVFGYKNNPFVFTNNVDQVFLTSMYLTLQRRNGLWFYLKKGLLGLKILLRRRNTTSLTKCHSLTLHTSPDSWELTKHRTCEATVVKKIHIQK
jgi:hypothetical protein